jgi:hypothetical protein
VKLSEVLSNRVSAIINMYRDHMKFAAYMAYSFITFFRVLLVPFLLLLYIYIYVYHHHYLALQHFVGFRLLSQWDTRWRTWLRHCA